MVAKNWYASFKFMVANQALATKHKGKNSERVGWRILEVINQLISSLCGAVHGRKIDNVFCDIDIVDIEDFSSRFDDQIVKHATCFHHFTGKSWLEVLKIQTLQQMRQTVDIREGTRSLFHKLKQCLLVFVIAFAIVC